MHSLCGPIKWMASLALYKQTLSATTANFSLLESSNNKRQRQQQQPQQEVEHTRATVHGIMLVRKLSKTNAAFQLSNLPAALKIERSIGRLRVAKVSAKGKKINSSEMLEMDEHAE